jgi:hypothetical protein
MIGMLFLFYVAVLLCPAAATILVDG